MLFQNDRRRLLIPVEQHEQEERDHDERADDAGADRKPRQERVAHA
jgi:hypothetical protein